MTIGISREIGVLLAGQLRRCSGEQHDHFPQSCGNAIIHTLERHSTIVRNLSIYERLECFLVHILCITGHTTVRTAL